MTADCVFCGIVTAAVERSLVHEDEGCVVVMDLMPVNPGHALVLPKRHADLLRELEPGERAHLIEVGVRTAEALRRSSIRCEGVNFWIADGAAAGQDVPQVHLHVLPRFAQDPFRVAKEGEWGPEPRPALDAAAAEIRRVWDD